MLDLTVVLFVETGVQLGMVQGAMDLWAARKLPDEHFDLLFLACISIVPNSRSRTQLLRRSYRKAMFQKSRLRPEAERSCASLGARIAG